MADREEDVVIAEMRENRRRRKEAAATFDGIAEKRKAVIEAEEKVSAERRGLFSDAALGAARAIPGAFEESFDLLATIDEAMISTVGALDFNPFDNTGQGIYRSPAEIASAESAGNVVRSPVRMPEEGLGLIKDTLPETERFTGSIVEPIGKFVMGFVTGKRGLQAVDWLQGTTKTAKFANATVAGAVSDVAVFDGHEGRLSNMIESVPALSNPVTEWLAADEDDGELEGRIKGVLEGAGVGAVFESVMVGLKGVKAWRTNRAIEQAVKKADETRVPLPETPAPRPEPEAPKTTDDTVQEGVKSAEEPEAPKQTAEELIEQHKADNRRTVQQTMQVTDEQAVAFRKAMAAGDEEAASAVLKDFNENNIDWSKIEDGDDIKQILLTTEKVFADLITDAKGGVQSNAQTRMLANLVDATPAEIGNLFRDTRGGGGIAARFYAAQRTMMASAAEVKRTARESLANPGSSRHQADALRALQVHAAIQAEVKGAQTEIARALQGMGMIKESAAENYREFEELHRQFAGSGAGKSAWEKQMDMILGMRNLDELNAHVRMTPWEKASNMFIEYTINSMLSSPKTHVINFVSNVLNTGIYSLDRTLGGSYRYLAKGDRQALREARIDVWSKLSRLDEAFKLAKQAWKDGAPVTDKRQRIEFQTRTSISKEGTSRDATAADNAAPEFGSKIITPKTEAVRNSNGEVLRAVDHKFMGRVVNTLGRAIRAPGRALITGDEFFKAVNRNAEISVLAFRQADEEALAKGLEYGSDAYEKFLKNRIAKLSDTEIRDLENVGIQAKAIEKSRRVTFQEAPTTSFGSKAEQFVNSNRWIKLVVAPFFRTPMNILRQGAFDRTPLGRLFDANKEILKNGHPRDIAEVQSRMLTGVAAMSVFYNLVGNEEEDRAITVVGKVSYGTSAKTAGVGDYSIRFGNSDYYQFSRLEPMGMWLGMIADMKTAAMYSDDDEWVFALGQGAVGAFMNNVGSKTYMKSLADIQEMFEGVKTSKPATIERAIDRFLGGEFGKLIPQVVKAGAQAAEGDGNRFAQEAWDVLDIMSARSSLFDADLPLQHDALGRPIPRDSGLSIMFNPFAATKNSDDPVDKEMFRLGFTLQPMPKSIGGGAVQLDNKEYSRLTGLVAKTGIHQTLTQLVTSEVWSGLSDPMKKVLMKEQISKAREAAHKMFLGTGDILERVGDEKITAASLLTPDAE